MRHLCATSKHECATVAKVERNGYDSAPCAYLLGVLLRARLHRHAGTLSYESRLAGCCKALAFIQAACHTSNPTSTKRLPT